MSYRYFVYSLLSGLLFWLAWPTNGFAGLLFFAFVPLFTAERSIRKKKIKGSRWKVFILSYISFLIWNLGATYWLYFSTPFGMFFAVLVNSLLMSTVFTLYHIIAKRNFKWPALIFFSSFWLAFEWFHHQWEFSWPWLSLGNVFSENPEWVQWYEYTGIAGGSIWVIIVNIIVYRHLVYSRNLLRSKSKMDSEVRSRKIAKKIILPALIIGIPIVFSIIITPGETSIRSGNPLNVIILQPNIDPYSEKYEVSNKIVAQGLNELIKPAITEYTDLILGPETVFADHMRIEKFTSDPALIEMKTVLNKYPNVSFVSGSSFLEIFKNEERKQVFSNYDERSMLFYNDYNSAFKVGLNQITETYHKSKLVVGVEHFPYRSVLEPILGDAMLDMGGSTSTKGVQEEAQVFNLVKNIKVAPIICYESVYGEYVGEFVNKGAQVLTIITNDAWWGNTQGHQQHLSLARLRAIEHRRWVARSANTGISAIISPTGEITSQTKYDEEGVITAKVFTNDTISFYSIHGDYLYRACAFIAAFIFIFSFVRKGKMRRK